MLEASASTLQSLLLCTLVQTKFGNKIRSFILRLGEYGRSVAAPLSPSRPEKRVVMQQGADNSRSLFGDHGLYRLLVYLGDTA
jgi:hypothetical protein